jgi:DNA-binding YbaB/EbfC family protein
MNLQKMMKQAQQMQQKIADMQAQMDTYETDGNSGGGAVSIRLNGKNQMMKINIDASLLKPEEKEMLEDLIIAAYRDAREKIDSHFSDQMGSVTGGLDLPPGFKLPF